jgi:Mg/Co/Ni transporter MgtE
VLESILFEGAFYYAGKYLFVSNKSIIIENKDGDNLQKFLFFDKRQRDEFMHYLNNQLEIKNRLLGMIIINPDRKTSGSESSKKALKYEQQITLLQNMLNHCSSIKNREDIKWLNGLIDQYNLISNNK